MSEDLTLSDFIERRYILIGLTQKALATECGCDSRTVRKIMKYDMIPGLDLAGRLADGLKIPSKSRKEFIDFIRGRRELTKDLRELIDPKGPKPPSIAEPSHTLPTFTTPFIGRESERKTIRSRLLDAEGKVRLVTLIGLPGMGKSRLGCQIAYDMLSEFDDGVFHVDLTGIEASEEIVAAIARALNVKETGNLLDDLQLYLHHKAILLLLDNVDPSPEPVDLIEKLVMARHRAKLRVIVTSQDALEIPGEQKYEVKPLAFPSLNPLPALDDLEGYEAIKLFVDRAQRVQLDFELTQENAADVARICHRLDGWPFAIELVAPLIETSELFEILEQLDQQSSELDRLRAAIELSYRRLKPAEQELLRRMAVFIRGCTLDAARKVCSADNKLIRSLLNKGFLWQPARKGDKKRFSMLQIVREFALSKWNTNEAKDIPQSHAEYYLLLMEDADLVGPNQQAWLDQLEEERHNLYAALKHDQEKAALLSASFRRFWEARGYIREGYDRLNEIRTDELSTQAQIEWHNAMGVLARQQALYPAAEQHHITSLDLAKSLGDKRAQATSLKDLGEVFAAKGNDKLALEQFERALPLYEESNDQRGIATTHYNMGIVRERLAKDDDDRRQSKEHLQRSLDIRLELEALREIAWCRTRLASISLKMGALGEAKKVYRDSIQEFLQLDDDCGLIECLEGWARVAAEQGKHTKAAEYLGTAEAGRKAIGYRRSQAEDDADRHFRAELEVGLGKEQFGESWVKGQAMTLQQAAEYALKEDLS